LREANFEGLTAAEEQRVGRGGAWRDEVARDVAWRSQRGLLSRCEGCRRQAGRQAEHVACGGGGFERVRLQQRNVHGCFFLLSPRRPTPPLNQQTSSPLSLPTPLASHLRPPPPPLPHGPAAPCDRRRPTLAPSSNLARFGAHRRQRGLVCIAQFGGSGGVREGGDGVCPILQRPSDNCFKHLLIQGYCYTCLLCDRPSRP